jgi:hypothetical protein
VTSATDRQPTKSPTVRYWIHPDKQRYYQAELVLDLFGCWTLTTFFGGLQNRRGNYRLTAVGLLRGGVARVGDLGSPPAVPRLSGGTFAQPVEGTGTAAAVGTYAEPFLRDSTGAV